MSNKNLEKIRHSLAHLMAMAILDYVADKRGKTFVKLGIGPVIENGFYYDFDFVEADKRGFFKNRSGLTRINIGTSDVPNIKRDNFRTSDVQKLTESDLPELEKRIRELIKQNLKFQKEIIPFSEAKKLFANQPYKLGLVKELQKSKKPITIYKTFNPNVKCQKSKVSSQFIDLCAGPHINSTKKINPDAFKLTKISGAYWKGDEKNQMLTRIYGVAFETKKELDDYLKLQEEIEKRDHRKLGEKLDLFSFHDIAPGAAFWHPKGMIILNELQNFIRRLQKERGYLETLTPILVKKGLYEASGHWKHYQENIFPLEIDKETFALKPMNCPESAYIYKSKLRSYKDLPMRLSEFGNLYRQERSGTLTGLFRVYGFIQDDAHIFCRPDQILEEINGVLELLTKIHKTFNLKTLFAFATKPDKAMGAPKLWVKAEKALKTALEKNKLKYELRPKDGAFYGPKIDIDVEDCLGRKWTVATIQLDFQIPERLGLEYIDEKGEKQRPIIIHRSSIGSFERFIGILIEHFSGALPLWLSPVQTIIIPVSDKFNDYGNKILQELKNNGIRAEIDDNNETLGKRIRNAELQKIPYILVVGQIEQDSETVNVRASRGQAIQGSTGGTVRIEKFIEKIKNEIQDKII